MTTGCSCEPRRSKRHRDAGTATAEFAVVMPAIVLLIVVLAGAAAVGFSQLRAFDAARSAARRSPAGNHRQRSSPKPRSTPGKPPRCWCAPRADTRR